MLFSDAFSVEPGDNDDWFDPILFTDTKLFLDPFLLFDNEFGLFEGSHAEIISFFDSVFRLVAQAEDERSRSWREALDLLELNEVSELCLGYTGSGTQGSGSGRGLARQMARGLRAAVRQGIDRLDHFEEVQIFEEGIGADRISDATAGIIRHRLATYTQNICVRHNVETRQIRYGKARFDPQRLRWRSGLFNLPTNPFTNEPILLAPKAYLRALPTINSEDFWDYCFSNHNDTIRREFGDEISRNVDKASIVELAQKYPDLRRRYVRSKEIEGSEPYDLRADTSGYYQPYLGARGWSSNNLLRQTISSSEELLEAVIQFVSHFSHFVENNDGWRLLWNDDGTTRKEVSFQALFSGVIIPHCQANNIDISKEANIGRGPVDFKFSIGYQCRVLIEAKLANNTKFWNGLRKQLPAYLRAEKVDCGIFLVACQRDQDFDRTRDISRIATEISAEANVVVRVVVVDCRASPPSASRL